MGAPLDERAPKCGWAPQHRDAETHARLLTQRLKTRGCGPLHAGKPTTRGCGPEHAGTLKTRGCGPVYAGSLKHEGVALSMQGR
eukprot:138863-Chlamydomonas_euryale.AAC.1